MPGISIGSLRPCRLAGLAALYYLLKPLRLGLSHAYFRTKPSDDLATRAMTGAACGTTAAMSLWRWLPRWWRCRAVQCRDAASPSLVDQAGGDNDSLLRLVEVRDLLAGQGWFDLHQYRMGPEGGFVMHWSRLVDAPIAAIILVVSAADRQHGHRPKPSRRSLWPALLLCLARVLHRSGGAQLSAAIGAVLPAVVIGAAALHFIGIFSPGALDHHNVQLVLTMASLSAAARRAARRWAAAACRPVRGADAGGRHGNRALCRRHRACVAGAVLFGDAGERRWSPDFGLGFAGVSALVFVATVPPRRWGRRNATPSRSGNSRSRRSPASGLAADRVARLRASRSAARLVALAAARRRGWRAVVALFPQCLAAPYADLDPRLKDIVARPHRRGAVAVQILLINDPAAMAGSATSRRCWRSR